MTKSKEQKKIESALANINNALGDLEEPVSTDPYVVDAQAFLTQAKVMLGKQLQLRGVGPKK
jgi:hypothetical protein